MGSLMAGWDSPTSSSPKGVIERNKSLTNEEIETFWKMKRKAQEEHLKAVVQEGISAECLEESMLCMEKHIFRKEALLSVWKNLCFVPEANVIAVHRKVAAYPRVGLDMTSRSFPGGNTTTVAADSCLFGSDDLHNLRSAEAWWTRSSWAFLNGPPLMAMEDPAHKYAPQHCVSARGCKHGHQFI